jgi:hypothetical protein
VLYRQCDYRGSIISAKSISAMRISAIRFFDDSSFGDLHFDNRSSPHFF